MGPIDLVEAERQSFRAATDTGLWDIMIAAVFSMLAIGPLLSGTLGDFGAAAAFVPVWLGLYLGILWVRKRIVTPRVGTIRIGREREGRLRRVAWALLGINVLALAGSLVAVTQPVSVGEWSYPVTLGLVCLAGFTLGGYFLDVPRYYVYGTMLVAAPALGELLWRRGLASHHGFPVVFGAAAIVITLGGVLRFIRVVPLHAPPLEEADPGNGP